MAKRKVTKHSSENIDHYQTISDPAGDEIQEYCCTFCNSLLKIRLSHDEYWCPNCQITHLPQQQQQTLMKKSKLVTPNQRDTAPCVSSAPSGYEDVVKIKKDPKLKGSFRLLRDKGLKITNYEEYNP